MSYLEATPEEEAAYVECQKRGHESSGTTLTSNPPWSVCRFCGVAYRYEKTLIEMPRTPELPGGG